MRSRTPADIPTHARTRIRTRAKTHAITHAHANANVQAHKYTQIRAFARSRANTHKQAPLGVRRARAPPALYIPAPAPVSYVQRSSDFRLARENMVSYLLHSWEGYLMP